MLPRRASFIKHVLPILILHISRTDMPRNKVYSLPPCCDLRVPCGLAIIQSPAQRHAVSNEASRRQPTSLVPPTVPVVWNTIDPITR